MKFFSKYILLLSVFILYTTYALADAPTDLQTYCANLNDYGKNRAQTQLGQLVGCWQVTNINSSDAYLNHLWRSQYNYQPDPLNKIANPTIPYGTNGEEQILKYPFVVSAFWVFDTKGKQSSCLSVMHMAHSSYKGLNVETLFDSMGQLTVDSSTGHSSLKYDSDNHQITITDSKSLLYSGTTYTLSRDIPVYPMDPLSLATVIASYYGQGATTVVPLLLDPYWAPRSIFETQTLASSSTDNNNVTTMCTDPSTNSNY